MAANGALVRITAMDIIALIREYKGHAWRSIIHAIERRYNLGHWCPRCRTYKPETEFAISLTRPRGLAGYCKVCVRDYYLETRNTRKQRYAFRKEQI
jgi:hypothetical protein